MKRYIIPFLFLAGIILVCGCMTPDTPDTNLPETTIPTTTPTPELTMQVTTKPVSEVSYVPQPTYPITTATTRVAIDNPYFDNLQVTKRYFPVSIPNCPMQLAFPAVASDPSYGIKQAQPKLLAYSARDYREFLYEYVTGSGADTRFTNVTKCDGQAKDPEWNFARVRIIVHPTNIIPTNYTISVNLLSDDTTIAQFKSTSQLVIDNPVTIEYYVPVKTTEMDLIDTATVAFSRQNP